ncbi:hypothetical protein DSO57_1000944 [Entomophthora muscae]|uniref:Uncharacterized protein n=1 Tax=Entomophthora muscae TaxID=34485 RepID=A0ACC2TK03_9FUNG|nr:hypothetical protein DSO57_1000944 [Entomophthora muscae]
MEPSTAAKTTSTQLFGVLYVTLTGMDDTWCPTLGPGPYLALILWWALLTGLAVPRQESLNTSTYTWLPDSFGQALLAKAQRWQDLVDNL